MTALHLTESTLHLGIWRGIVAGGGAGAPDIAVTLDNFDVPGVEIKRDDASGQWLVTFPVPSQAVCDGIHTLLIHNRADGAKLGHVTLSAGEPLQEDIRAELGLLRAELDMLKRAFRRHCRETT